MSGRPKTQLVLTVTERQELVALTLRRKTSQALALRARIVLACADGQDNKVVAARQRVAPLPPLRLSQHQLGLGSSTHRRLVVWPQYTTDSRAQKWFNELLTHDTSE